MTVGCFPVVEIDGMLRPWQPWSPSLPNLGEGSCTVCNVSVPLEHETHWTSTKHLRKCFARLGSGVVSVYRTDGIVTEKRWKPE